MIDMVEMLPNINEKASDFGKNLDKVLIRMVMVLQMDYPQAFISKIDRKDGGMLFALCNGCNLLALSNIKLAFLCLNALCLLKKNLHGLTNIF